MRIVTVSREFGSMGRELGRRIAEELGLAYYDREIITEIARETELDEGFVARVIEKGVKLHPAHYGVTFSVPLVNKKIIDVMVAQRDIIEKLASKGECVIVGRSADAILSDKRPFNAFVYADMETRIKRCREREGANGLTDKEIKRRIQEIDKGRAESRAMFSSLKWGERASYDLMINTTDVEIERIVPAVAAYIDAWFKCRGV